MAKSQIKPDEVVETTREHPLLRLLSPRALRSVTDASRVVPYRQKRSLLKEGDPAEHVFFLLTGSVRVFHRSNEGVELLLKLFKAPVMFGEMEVIAKRRFLEHVVTLEPSTVLLIPAQVFLQLLEHQPEFARAVAIDLAARLCIAADNLKAIAFSNVETRLANLLTDYAEMFGEKTPAGIRLSVPLTQESMARDLAVTRNAVGDVLKRLKEQRILEKIDARYVIRDQAKLNAMRSNTLGLSYAL